MPASVAPAARRCTGRAPPAGPSSRASAALLLRLRHGAAATMLAGRRHGRAAGAAGRHRPLRRPRRLDRARRAARPGGRARPPGRALRAVSTRRSSGSAGRRRSSSAMPCWPSSGSRRRTRTTRSAPSGPRSPARDQFAAFADRVRSAYGAEVGLRIGVNTGEVVAGREAAARGELMVSGDAVNVAARLQQTPSPGEVLVGERTQAATNRVDRVRRRAGRSRPRARRPVPAWAALDRARASRPSRARRSA